MCVQIKLGTSEILSIIGALSGVGSVAFNIFQWYSQKPKIAVSAAIMRPLIGDSLGDEVICVEILNARPRPVQVSFLYFTTCFMQKEGKMWVRNAGLPKILHEAEGVQAQIPIEVLNGKKLDDIFVNDALGNVWKVSSKEIEAINNKLYAKG